MFHLYIILSTEKKVEELLTLEAKYGPISGHKPVINEVLNYLSKVHVLYPLKIWLRIKIHFTILLQLIGSTDEQDRGLRIRL